MINALRNSAVGYRRRGGVSFGDEYQAVYDTFSTKPSNEIAAAQNTMVVSLVDADIWVKLDLFYLFAQTSFGDALTNWINPGTFNGTLVNAPAFVALEGFTGNGSNSYIRSNWIGSSDAIKYLLDDAGASVYVRTDVNESAYELGATNSTRFLGLQSRNSNTLFTRINDDTWGSVANLDSKGFYSSNRVGANQVLTYKNGVEIIDAANVSTDISTRELFICCLNNAGTPGNFSTKQISNIAVHGSLTVGEVVAYKNAIEAYMDSNGKGVIS